MKLLLFFSLLLIDFFNFCTPVDECKLMGIYRVEYENEFENKLITKIEFSDSTYLKTFELGKVKGIITKIKDKDGKCIIFLKDRSEQKVNQTKISQIETSNSKIGKLKTMGEPIMEISEPITDTIKFKIVYSGQLNVIIKKGKLIKL